MLNPAIVERLRRDLAAERSAKENAEQTRASLLIDLASVSALISVHEDAILHLVEAIGDDEEPEEEPE